MWDVTFLGMRPSPDGYYEAAPVEQDCREIRRTFARDKSGRRLHALEPKPHN
jgi:hypothetical protein